MYIGIFREGSWGEMDYSGWMEKTGQDWMEWILDTRGLEMGIGMLGVLYIESRYLVTAHAVLPHDVSAEVDKPLAIKNISY